MQADKTMERDRTTDYTGRSITLYHPNGRGTGSALRLEPRINREGEDRYNCFFLEMAAQKQVADRKGGGSDYATFDWDRRITVKLGFADICELLAVLEGKAEHVGGERKGLFHATGAGNTIIGFARDAERGGYHLSLSRKLKGDAEPRRIGIGLGEAEAVGLRCLFQTGLFFVTFPSALKRRPGPARPAQPHPVDAHAGNAPPEKKALPGLAGDPLLRNRQID